MLHISGLLTQDVIFLMSSTKFCLFMGTDIAELNDSWSLVGMVAKEENAYKRTYE